MELSEEAKQELRALGDLESRAIQVYGTDVIKKVNEYKYLDCSAAGGNTALPIWPVCAHSDPVNTDIA
ncbi:MAG: hypothetical protein ACKVK6_10245 [bacterium]